MEVIANAISLPPVIAQAFIGLRAESILPNRSPTAV